MELYISIIGAIVAIIVSVLGAILANKNTIIRKHSANYRY